MAGVDSYFISILGYLAGLCHWNVVDKMNRRGLRMLPCGVTARILTTSDRVLPILTWMVQLVRNDEMR